MAPDTGEQLLAASGFGDAANLEGVPTLFLPRSLLPQKVPFNMAQSSSYDFLIKLLLIGDSGVGKSCLLLRFRFAVFCDYVEECPSMSFSF